MTCCTLHAVPPPVNRRTAGVYRTCNRVLLQVVGLEVLGLELLTYGALRLVQLLIHAHLKAGGVGQSLGLSQMPGLALGAGGGGKPQ